MKKIKHYKVEYTSEISETGFDARKKFAESDSGKELGIYTEHKNGIEKINYGYPLQSNEFSGEGLPKSEDENSLCFEMNFSFDLRVSHNGRGDIELIVAQKGKGRHFKFVLKGLDARQAEIAVFEFRQRMSNCTIPQDFYYLIWACYQKQDENADVKKESYEQILSKFESRFRKLLMHGTYKPMESRTENGIEVTKSIAGYSGAPTQPKAEIEKEKQDFKEALFNAFELIETEGGNKKQLDVGLIVFEKESDAKQKASKGEKDIDAASRMKHALRKYNLKFKELLKEYEQKKGG